MRETLTLEWHQLEPLKHRLWWGSQSSELANLRSQGWAALGEAEKGLMDRGLGSPPPLWAHNPVAGLEMLLVNAPVAGEMH